MNKKLKPYRVFIKDANDFGLIKNVPLAYWVGGRMIKKLSVFDALQPNFGEARVGLQTGDDQRFLRLIWEVPLKLVPNIKSLDYNDWDFVDDATGPDFGIHRKPEGIKYLKKRESVKWHFPDSGRHKRVPSELPRGVKKKRYG